MANILRYRVVHSGISGAPYLTTHYSIANLSTAAAMRDAVAGFWQNTVGERAGGLLSTGESVIDEIRSEDGVLVNSTGVQDWSYAATGAGEVLPQATQGLLRLETGSIILGQRVRGKIYLPAPTVADNATGGTVVSYRQSYEDAWDTYLNVPNNVPAVWARKSGEAVPVNQVNVWAQFAVLRSRRD